MGTELCPLCCGQLRGKKIHCPPHCPSLAAHKQYQEKRIIQKKQAFSEDVLHDERLSWLSLHIEAPLKIQAEKNPAFADRDAILALEYAKDKVEEGKPKLLIPHDERRPQNEVGEAVLQSLNECRYQRKIVLLQEIEGYKKEDKLKCLENVILGVKALAKGNLQGRNYLQDLISRFTRVKQLSQQKKIISPP